MKGEERTRGGVISQGIKTPIIKAGDDLKEIVIKSVVNSNDGNFEDGDIIGVTEAVVAISQGNFVTHHNICDDVTKKFLNAEEIVIVDPIQSRNRFMDVLKAISQAPKIKKIYIVMSYPTDEVGNRLVSDMAIMQSNINPYSDILTVEEFYNKLGEPKHPFTGKNYIEEYLNACQGKAEVVLCNDFSKLKSVTKCDNFLICSIHRRKETRLAIERSGAKNIFDLSEIMDESINGSGYNKEFGLYGSNLMSGGRLKLMPRNCQEFVEEIQKEIQQKYGKKVEAFVYGDGAFKDPQGKIWELADPVVSPAFTDGLIGTPNELKLKYLADNDFKHLSGDALKEAISNSIKAKQGSLVGNMAAQGTTPRQLTDLIGSLCDLTSGSGDKGTPIVLVQGYFDNYTN